MARRQKTAKRPKPKTVLRLPDLEQSKNAVLNSLAAASSQESYRRAIDEFIGWYCSEPRLAFNRTVVLRYRFFLEQNHLAPSTINVRLAAVRRLAFEAADTGLLSPELAAGIRRVKGAKRLGIRGGRGFRSVLVVVWELLQDGCSSSTSSPAPEPRWQRKPCSCESSLLITRITTSCCWRRTRTLAPEWRWSPALPGMGRLFANKLHDRRIRDWRGLVGYSLAAIAVSDWRHSKRFKGDTEAERAGKGEKAANR